MFQTKLLAFTLLTLTTLSIASAGVASESNHVEKRMELALTKTEAGDINFNFFAAFDGVQNIYKNIVEYSEESETIVFDDGSRWQVSHIDSVRGWDRSHHLIITQNHKFFSTYKYALVNLENGQAVPISLVTPPTPSEKQVLFVKGVDNEHKILSLSNDQVWEVKEHFTLYKFHPNNSIVLGINSRDHDLDYPFLIIDASLNSNSYLRAKLFE